MPKKKIFVMQERMVCCPYCDRPLLLRANVIKMPKEAIEMRKKLAKKIDEIMEND